MQPTACLKGDANILIVDDVAENLKLLADTLLREGYQVRPARSGRVALDSARRRPPDLVLLDIRMPRMDGFAVCRRLKSDPRTADVPVIFISAVEELGDKIKAFDSGGVDYITKPFQEKEILSRVKTHLTLHVMHQNLEALVQQRTEELEKTNRALRLISHSNQLLVHVESEASLLQALCDSLVTIGGYPFCWIGYPHDADARVCTPTALAPSDAPLLHALAHQESADGPSVSALRTGSQVRLNDIENHPVGRPWREHAIGNGLFACLSIPLSDARKTRGTLTVYAARKDFFDASEAELLKELADNLALGLHMIREHRRRERAEIALKESEKRLHHAQKMEALGTLASGISHDFNNILYPIIGYAELALAHSDADTPNHRRLNEILGCAKRANGLVNQILAFSRQSKPELRTLRLQPVVQEAVAPFRSFLPHTISLDLQIDGTCGYVRADPTQIHQIVTNLMTNATHAMEETGGCLELSLQQEMLGPADLLTAEMRPGAYVCLRVADNGSGIDPTVMEKMFDPYFTTKEKGKGTGLGLAVVHGIVTGYGGGIRVTSTVGQGTQFDVFLPVSGHNGIAEVEAPAASLPAGCERILVVDDEPQSLNMLHESLSLLGYRVTRHAGSLSALAAFRTAPDRFDLVLTDYAMPEMNGAQMAEALLAIRPDIPIILCTGHGERFSDAHAAAAGIRKILRKPLLRDTLARIVRSTLDTPTGVDCRSNG